MAEIEVKQGAHGDGCECVRCVGFEPGHTLSVRHGAYSRRLLAGDAELLAPELEQAAPEASAPVISLSATVLAQVFRAAKAIDQAQPGELDDLRRDAHRWAARAESLLARMGLLADRDGTIVNVQNVLAASSEWGAIRSRIVAALGPHPAALDAVVQALEEGEADVAQG